MAPNPKRYAARALQPLTARVGAMIELELSFLARCLHHRRLWVML